MLTVDVGNSSVGVGSWAGVRLELARFAEPEDAAELLLGDAVAIAVSTPRWERLEQAVARGGRGRVRRLVGVPLEVADERLARTAGADRFAAALAVLPGPAVVVDAGTAVTVDLVDGSGVLRGGFIAPGPAAALRGLGAAAPALPALGGEPADVHPGVETHAALAGGAWGMAVGGVDKLVQAALDALAPAEGVALRIVATGGWGAAWAAHSRHPDVHVDEGLVHHGIARWSRTA